MMIFKKTSDLSAYIDNQREMGRKIGFVPTMGALHQGHISLINLSKNENDGTICSIFVNPAQFNNPEDFEKYPITIDHDIELLEAAGCDVLFLPSLEEIYPANFNNKKYELGKLDTILEGKHRPGHFQGVCMVVDRLLSIVSCDILYLGQKDYQQCLVLKKMIELENLDLKITIAATVREKNGLAMSSRNSRLSDQEKKQALCIYQSLESLKKNILPGDLTELKEKAINMISDAGFVIDYLAITDINLNPIHNWDGQTQLIVLAAASTEQVRLIDNMMITS